MSPLASQVRLLRSARGLSPVAPLPPPMSPPGSVGLSVQVWGFVGLEVTWAPSLGSVLILTVGCDGTDVALGGGTSGRGGGDRPVALPGVWVGAGGACGPTVPHGAVAASRVTASAPKGQVRSVLRLQFEFTSHKKALPKKQHFQPIHKNSP